VTRQSSYADKGSVMAVLVHVGSRSFTLNEEKQSTDELIEAINAAVQTQQTFSFAAVIGEAPLTVWVNTAQVDTIVVDENGAAIGFFSG
jgi:hypothetical protein